MAAFNGGPQARGGEFWQICRNCKPATGRIAILELERETTFGRQERPFVARRRRGLSGRQQRL